MIEFFGEALVLFMGIFAGTLAIFFAAVTIRQWKFGSEAYAANRAASPASVGAAFSGAFCSSKHENNRNNYGLAVNLVSGEFVPQQKLSKDAIADVIGRRI